jgi:hypothetical protein
MTMPRLSSPCQSFCQGNSDTTCPIIRWPGGAHVGGGAGVHNEGGADVECPAMRDTAVVSSFPDKQGGDAGHVPLALPGALPVAARVTPSCGAVGEGQDAAVEVGGPMDPCRQGPERALADAYASTAVLC